MKKIRKLLIGLAGLSLSLGAAIGVGLTADKGASEAKADGDIRLYLDITGFKTWYDQDPVTIKFKTYNDTHEEQLFDTVRVSDYCYYIDIAPATLEEYASGNGYSFARCSADGKTVHNTAGWITYSAGIKTCCYVTSWDYGNWSNSNQYTWTLVGAQNGTWTDDPATQTINYPLTFRFDADGMAFYNIDIDLDNGAVFKVKNSEGVFYGYEYMSSNALGYTYLSGSGDNNITVGNGGGKFEVYFKPLVWLDGKPKQGNYWMQVSSTTEIISFSTRFLTAMRNDDVCGNTKARQDDYNKSGIDTIWSTWKNEFDGSLTDGARNKFKEDSSLTNVSDAAKLYLHVVDRYGSSYIWTKASAVSSRVNPVTSMGTITSNVTLIIAISLTTLSVVAVGGYFFIRRRKEDR